MSAQRLPFPPVIFSWINLRLGRPAAMLSGVALIATLVACGAVSGKPSTSAPSGFDDPQELQQACAERKQAIDEWERGEEEKLAGKWADGEITLMRGAIEAEKIQEEAAAMRQELKDACLDKERELALALTPDGSDGQFRALAGTVRAGPTPVPTWTPAPTYTPEPTWTPEPSPTLTVTPLPTPTMTLQELAQANSAQCIGQFSSSRGERRPVGNEMPHEVIAIEDGSAYVKAGYFSLEPHFGYWKYLPGPVRGTFECREIGYEEYPTPTPVSAKGEERIKQVALIADEVCRIWTSQWEGRKTFEGSDRLAHRTDNPSRFHLEEIRPLNEVYALARVQHLIGHPSTNALKGGLDYQRVADRYLLYSAQDNTCRETGISAEAWNAWPQVVPELE